jgi:hypothetical protein
MNAKNKSIAASQWSLSPVNIQEEETYSNPLPQTDHPKSLPVDTIKRLGFFEAISHSGPAKSKLENLLESYEQKAREKINTLEEIYEKKVRHLSNRISSSASRIEELKQKLSDSEKYNEADDLQLQKIIEDKLKEEERLAAAQEQITEVRVRLGEAKAGIINKSLDEAEAQVRKALNIQNLVYDETRILNGKKYEDEKDYLTRLAKCYQELHDYYKNRYDKVNSYLHVLDVDGISPKTTSVLTTIGTVSFGAAGFFFSTFAGNTGFGNQDMLYYVLDGLITTAQQPANGFAKVGVLFGIIALITLISLGCNFLISRLKNKDEEIFTKLSLGGNASAKLELLEYQANLKSNNWYAFWLQLLPGVFIAGLLILCLSINYRSTQLIYINASSEGLIIGTSIAISLAGLIYLYITKIVEPRLLKRHEANPNESINWIKANWEIVTILILFVVFSIFIILIPTGIAASTDLQVRYALLLFLAICLVGSMSFAYGMRNRGLIQTGRYLEKVIKWLNKAIAYCSAPETPQVHNTLAAEHGNILEHVLKQLSFKAAVNLSDGRVRRKRKSPGLFGELMDVLKLSKESEETSASEHISYVTIMEPWEERYFPHIVDELKAKEFEYREKRVRLQLALDHITDYKSARTNMLRLQENEIALCRETIKECETLIESALQERADCIQQARADHEETITNLLDGFDLGVWYKNNGLGADIPVSFDISISH